MRIESVTATSFGALQGQTLEFGPGLTVVYGRNESAKSTWHAAIYSAVCGRPRRRGAATKEQQRFAERYRPWAHPAWEVQCRLLLDDGRRIEIHRDLDGQVDCAAIDIGLGTDVSGDIMYQGSPDASRWLGLNREVFWAIASVRQADILSVLGHASDLQEHLESAASHAGMSDSTAAQAIEAIQRFAKENVGKDRTNSTKPLRRAALEVQQARDALEHAQQQHGAYLGLVREAYELHEQAVQADEAAASAQAHVTRLTAFVQRATEIAYDETAHARASEDLAAAVETRDALAQRLADATAARALCGDTEPTGSHDGQQTLATVTEAITLWEGRQAPPDLQGPDAAALMAQLEEVPAMPRGDLRPDPAVLAAAQALEKAAAVAESRSQDEAPVPQAGSPQVQAARAVGAATLRAWAAETDQIHDVSPAQVDQTRAQLADAQRMQAAAQAEGARAQAEIERLLSGGGTQSPIALLAAAIAVVAGLGLLATGNVAAGAAVLVLGVAIGVVALLRGPRGDSGALAQARAAGQTQQDRLIQAQHQVARAEQELASVQASHRRAQTRRTDVQAQISTAGLACDLSDLRRLAAIVDRMATQQQARDTWQRSYATAAQAMAHAQADLATALRDRGVDCLPEAAQDSFEVYRTACERRTSQATQAGRADALRTAIQARTTQEAAAARARDNERAAHAKLDAAAVEAGVPPDEDGDALAAALVHWRAQRQAKAAHQDDRRSAWTRLLTALGGLSVVELTESAAQADERVARLRPDLDSAASALQQRRGDLQRDAGGPWDVPTLQARVEQAAADASARVAAASQARATADTARGSHLDRAHHLPSVAEAEERLAAALRERARVEDLAATVSLTTTFLSKAQDTVHRDLAPTLQATLTRWLPTVTDGRYTQASVNPQTLRVSVKTGAGVWKDAALLSMGTAEQIYLLLRVALVTHLSSPHAACPMLLDDVTVQADEPRTRALLATLAQLARDRQIVLFAQEPTVQMWARDREDVRLLGLEQVPA